MLSGCVRADNPSRAVLPSVVCVSVVVKRRQPGGPYPLVDNIYVVQQDTQCGLNE